MKFNEYCRSRKYGVIVREDMESISYKNTHVELTQEYESIDGCIKDIEYELLIISGEQSWLYGDGLYGIIEKDYIIKKDWFLFANKHDCLIIFHLIDNI